MRISSTCTGVSFVERFHIQLLKLPAIVLSSIVRSLIPVGVSFPSAKDSRECRFRLEKDTSQLLISGDLLSLGEWNVGAFSEFPTGDRAEWTSPAGKEGGVPEIADNHGTSRRCRGDQNRGNSVF